MSDISHPNLLVYDHFLWENEFNRLRFSEATPGVNNIIPYSSIWKVTNTAAINLDVNNIITSGYGVRIPFGYVDMRVDSNIVASTAYNHIGCGFTQHDDSFIVCKFSLTDDQAFFQYVQPTPPTDTRWHIFYSAPTPPWTMRFILNGNIASMYIDVGAGFNFVMSQDVSSIVDLTTLDLSTWKTSAHVATKSLSSSPIEWSIDYMCGFRDRFY